MECVGCADRSCYDLLCHQKATGVKLVAEKPLKEPVERTFVNIVPKRQVLGKTFKQASKDIAETLMKMDEESVNAVEAAVAGDG